MDGRCDATASGVELAKAVVYTPRGPIELCRHHLRKHMPATERLGYAALWRDVVPSQMPPLDVVMGPGIPAAEMTRSYSY